MASKSGGQSGAAIYEQTRAAVVFSIQQWLAESPAKQSASGTPGYFSVIMACKLMHMAL